MRQKAAPRKVLLGVNQQKECERADEGETPVNE